MTKRKKLTKKKKEKIFEVIVGTLAFAVLFSGFFSIVMTVKNRELAEKIMLFTLVWGGLIYIPLVFYILPYVFFKDEMSSGGAKKVFKEKLKFISFEDLEKNFIIKLEDRNIEIGNFKNNDYSCTFGLEDRNIEIGNFKNNDYSCTFGLYNNKSYAIGEELIYLKNPSKKNIKDYKRNFFDELCTYISFEEKYAKYARRYIETLMIIVVDELNPDIEKEINSDIIQFGSNNRFPVFISLKEKEIFIPIQKSQLGIGEWRKIKKIFIQNYEWMFENNMPEI